MNQIILIIESTQVIYLYDENKDIKIPVQVCSGDKLIIEM